MISQSQIDAVVRPLLATVEAVAKPRPMTPLEVTLQQFYAAAERMYLGGPVDAVMLAALATAMKHREQPVAGVNCLQAQSVLAYIEVHFERRGEETFTKVELLQELSDINERSAMEMTPAQVLALAADIVRAAEKGGRK